MIGFFSCLKQKLKFTSFCLFFCPCLSMPQSWTNIHLLHSDLCRFIRYLLPIILLPQWKELLQAVFSSSIRQKLSLARFWFFWIKSAPCSATFRLEYTANWGFTLVLASMFLLDRLNNSKVWQVYQILQSRWDFLGFHWPDWCN